jgi:hypothetical protein
MQCLSTMYGRYLNSAHYENKKLQGIVKRINCLPVDEIQ